MNKSWKRVLAFILAAGFVTTGCSVFDRKEFKDWIKQPEAAEETEKAIGTMDKGIMYTTRLSDINSLTKDMMRMDVYCLLKFFSDHVPDFKTQKEYGGEDPLSHMAYWFYRIDTVKNNFDYFILIREITKIYKSPGTELVMPYDFPNIIKFPNHPDEKVLSDPKVILKNQQFMKVLKDNSWKEGAKSLKREDNVFTGVTEDGKTAYLKINSFDLEGKAPDGTTLGISDFMSHLNDYENLIIDIRGNQSLSTEPWRNEILARLIDYKKLVSTYIGTTGDKMSDNVLNYFENMDENVRALTEKGVDDRFSLNTVTFEEEEMLPNFLSNTGTELSLLKRFVKVTDEIEPIDPVGYHGKIYLLQDANVLYSGDLFSYYLRSLGMVNSVGKHTKGAGVAGIYGVRYFALPYSGLVFRAQTVYGFNMDGSPNNQSGTITNYYVENGEELDFVLDRLKMKKIETLH